MLYLTLFELSIYTEDSEQPWPTSVRKYVTMLTLSERRPPHKLGDRIDLHEVYAISWLNKLNQPCNMIIAE